MSDTSDPAPTVNRFREWCRWLVRPQLCFGGLAVGTICFLLSLTPSLLPRSGFAQGAVSGLSLVCGYGIGSALSAAARSFGAPQPSDTVRRIAWWALAAVALVGSITMLWLQHGWQDELRDLVGITDGSSPSPLVIAVVAVVVALLVLFISRLVRSGTRFVNRQVERVLPRKVAVAIGVTLVVVVTIGFAQGVLWRGFVSAMNSTFSVIDESTRDDATEPTSSLRSGGPDSAVSWESLGRMGRSFVGAGPDVEDLEDFGGPNCCEEPIRVYVGLDSAPTTEERAQLVVDELVRTGGFEREVLAIYTTTGTGWINPNVSESLEYIHGGDTATATMQYSFLPSWISVLVDEKKAGDATRELITAVQDHMATIEADARPMVLLFGESLGSFGMETGTGSIEAMQDVSDGVMLIGPTYDNPVRQQITKERVSGSPEWRPEVARPDGVHFATEPADLDGVAAQSGPKVVYLQNASDPVTWWNVSLLWDRPDWAGAPAAPDRSPALRWMPVVTFWQVVGDLPGAGEVPAGHGHIFGENVVDGWLALDTPDGWSAEDTQRLRGLMDDAHG